MIISMAAPSSSSPSPSPSPSPSHRVDNSPDVSVQYTPGLTSGTISQSTSPDECRLRAPFAIPCNLASRKRPGAFSPSSSSFSVLHSPSSMPPNMYRFQNELIDFDCDWQSIYFAQRLDLLPPGASVFVQDLSRQDKCVGILHVIVGIDLGTHTSSPEMEMDLVRGSVEEPSDVLNSYLRPSLLTLQRGVQNALSLAHRQISVLNCGSDVQVRIPLLGAGIFRTQWEYALKPLAISLLSAIVEIILQLKASIQIVFVLKEEGGAVVVREAFQDVLRDVRFERRQQQIRSFVTIVRGDIIDPFLGQSEDVTSVPSQPWFLINPCDCELKLARGLAVHVSKRETNVDRQRAVLQLFRQDYWQTKHIEVARFRSALTSIGGFTLQHREETELSDQLIANASLPRRPTKRARLEEVCVMSSQAHH